MANFAARMLLKNGKSFPQVLRSRLVGLSSNVNVCNKDQLFAESLIKPSQQLYLQPPVLGDGFNFVDFVLGKDQELRAEHWKSSATVEARGERRHRYGSDEDNDDDDDDDDAVGDADDEEFNGYDLVDFEGSDKDGDSDYDVVHEDDCGR